MRLSNFIPAPALLIAALLGCAPASHAHPRRVVVVRPYTHVVVNRGHYWYHDGYYYRRHGSRYLLTAAPRGAVVTVVPAGAIRLRFGAVHYRYFGGVYYQSTPRGYVVVERPATIYLEREVETTAPDTVFVEPTYRIVNVRNTNGSEIPVRLEQEGAKWKGPKGELYDDFPSDDQLRQAYGF